MSDTAPAIPDAIRDALSAYQEHSTFRGCSPEDYATLYRVVRRIKPRYALECGTGVSTLVLAHALRENGFGHLTSMEEDPQYYQQQLDLFPQGLRSVVDIRLSPREDTYFHCFRGTHYAEVPALPYRFVFIDGPNYTSVSDEQVSCNLDFLDVVRRAERNVFGLLDGRLSTAFVLQSIFPKRKVRTNVDTMLTWLGPCTKQDIPVIRHRELLETLARRALRTGRRRNTSVALR